MNEKKTGRRARIRTGAIVGQDHHFCEWQDDGEIFDVYEFLPHLLDLKADGYGNLDKPNCYGNGSLFVEPKDVIYVDEPAHGDHPGGPLDRFHGGVEVEEAGKGIALMRCGE